MSKKEKAKTHPAPAPAPIPAATRPSRLRPWLPLAGIILFGALIRFNMVLWQPLIFPDSLQYMHLAREIRTGVIFEQQYDLDGGFVKSRRLPPFYSLLLAPFAESSADLETVGHLISILLSLYSFIPLYLVTAMIFSRRAAFMAGVLFAFHSLVNKFAAPILTESAFTAIYLTVIWLSLLGLRRKSWLLLAGAGAFSALTYLTRDVGITAVAVVAAGVAVRFLFVDRLPPRRVALLLAVVVGAFLVVAAPYFVHIRVRTGHWGLTLQMSNTTITEQVQLYGGDRFDRDRISVEEKRTRSVSANPAATPLGLIRVAPQVALKVVRNSWGYFRELLVKAQSLPVLLLFVGLLAVGVDFRRERDRARLFDQLWPAVWFFQLLFLYALITPYMVDIRYMYPTLPLLLLFDARAVTFLSSRASASAVEKTGSVWPAAAAVAVFCAFILVYAGFTDGEAYAKLQMILGERLAPIRKLFTVLSVTAFLAVILLLFASVDPLRKLTARPVRSRVIIGSVVFGVGVVLMFVIAFLGGRISDTALAAFVAAPGLALLLSGLLDGRPRTLLLDSVLLAGLLLFCAPDTIYQWNWYSSRELTGKYSAGYKEAAAEIRGLRLVPTGSVICARKPFVVYYLDGVWYLDEEQQPIPKRDARLMELIRERKIDFLFLDTFTMKTLRPALTERALAIEPMPGATLVYSRHFPEYNRIITLFDCRHDEPEPVLRASAASYFRVADERFRQGQYAFALRELREGLKLDPNSPGGWYMTIKILGIYFDCSSRADVSSLALAPRVLPALLKASENFYRLNPKEEGARLNYLHVKKAYDEEAAILRGVRPDLVGADD